MVLKGNLLNSNYSKQAKDSLWVVIQKNEHLSGMTDLAI